MSKNITRAEAEAFTQGLGHVTVGNIELMESARSLGVPEALDMEFDEWVERHLGGFVQRSVEDRRKMVAELSGKKIGEGRAARYERSATEVAALMGISANTVRRDLEVLAVTLEGKSEGQMALSTGGAVTLEGKSRPKLTSAEKDERIRELIARGFSDAQIAVELDVGVSTVGKVRGAVNKEARANQQDRDEQLAEDFKSHEGIHPDEIPEEPFPADFIADAAGIARRADGLYHDVDTLLGRADPDQRPAIIKKILPRVRRVVERLEAGTVTVPDYPPENL